MFYDITNSFINFGFLNTKKLMSTDKVGKVDNCSFKSFK